MEDEIGRISPSRFRLKRMEYSLVFWVGVFCLLTAVYTSYIYFRKNDIYNLDSYVMHEEAVSTNRLNQNVMRSRIATNNDPERESEDMYYKTFAFSINYTENPGSSNQGLVNAAQSISMRSNYLFSYILHTIFGIKLRGGSTVTQMTFTTNYTFTDNTTSFYLYKYPTDKKSKDIFKYSQYFSFSNRDEGGNSLYIINIIYVSDLEDNFNGFVVDSVRYFGTGTSLTINVIDGSNPLLYYFPELDNMAFIYTGLVLLFIALIFIVFFVWYCWSVRFIIIKKTISDAKLRTQFR